jgi:hypothetical protein
MNCRFPFTAKGIKRFFASSRYFTITLTTTLLERNDDYDNA